MNIDYAVQYYLDRYVPLNLIVLIVPKNYKNDNERHFSLDQTNAKGNTKKVDMEFQQTKHGLIRVIRHNAVQTPIVIETATQFVLEDGKIRYK